MIKAVIFDCFGVLTTDGWLPFRDKYFAGDPEKLDKANELMHRVDAGIYRYEDLVSEVATMAGVSEQFLASKLDGNVANTKLFDYIHGRLKPHYKIGMLSNAGADWLSELFNAKQMALFDATKLSFETGFLKPRPEAYQQILDALDVQPAEAVFVDDQQRHCDGAVAVGLQTIQYENFEQMKSTLEKILNDSER